MEHSGGAADQAPPAAGATGFFEMLGAAPAATGFAEMLGAAPAATGFAEGLGAAAPAAPAATGFAEGLGAAPAVPAATGFAEGLGSAAPAVPAATGFAEGLGSAAPAAPAATGFAEGFGSAAQAPAAATGFAEAPGSSAAAALPPQGDTAGQGGDTTTYSGYISSAGAKFGFIVCDLVKAVYNEDVWVGWSNIQGLSVGDPVDFELGFSDRGKPQALNVRPAGAPPPALGGPNGAGGGSGDFKVIAQKFGTVSAIGPNFGFIDCPPVKAEHGCDVFCHSSSLIGFNIGDVVDFDLGFNDKGQPQAANLRPRPGKGGKGKGGGKGCAELGGKGAPWPQASAGGGGGKGRGVVVPPPNRGAAAGGSSPAAANILRCADGQAVTFTGSVSSAGPQSGFIQCEEVQAQYNCDVFCPGNLLVGISVGEAVDFNLSVDDDGQPLACNIRRQGLPPGPRVVPPRAGGPSQVALPAAGGGSGGAPGGAKGCCKGAPGLGGGVVAKNRYYGIISSIRDKYGFIVCQPVRAQHNADVFVPAGFIVGWSVGDTVEFDLGFNDRGQPQASHVSALGGGKGITKGGSCKGGGKVIPPPSRGGGGMADAGKGCMGKAAAGGCGAATAAPPPATPTGESFLGVVSSIGPKFGFIQSADVTAKYGSDTFAHPGQLTGLNVGDPVQFGLQVTAEGKPQAVDLSPAGWDPSGGDDASRKRKLDQTEWLV